MPDAGPRRTDSPGSLAGPGKAVPRLRCFRFGLPGMNHPPFPPPGLFSSLLRPRPPWAASRPEQRRPGVGAARWSRSRRPCAVVPAPGGRGLRGPGVRSRPPGSRREAAAAPVPGLARSAPRPRPCRPGPDPRAPAAPRAGCRKGAGWLSPAPAPATRLRPRLRRRGARPGPADGPARSAGRAASFHDVDAAREPPPGID